ncbi:permease-like cell division protein FtsX, partial [Pseudomonadota bacterium]
TRWSEISAVDYITAEEALDDFRQNSGLGDALGLLDQNPLPGVLVVYPTLSQRTPALAQDLLEKLRALPEVDMAQLDMEWIQRLHTIIAFADRAIAVLGGALALAVLFVIGNTIRMAIQNRRDEIEVTKLIGGSDAFVRRPFLYNGMWFGLFGGILAWLLVNILLILLDDPVQSLAALYDSDFRLGLVGVETTFLLLFSGPFLGLVGAWLVAGRHLKAIEPV